MEKNEFEALSKEEQKIEIAKDIISQIKIGKINPLRQIYVDTDLKSDGKLDKCYCCAKGATLLGYLSKKNICILDFKSYRAVDSNSTVIDTLKGIFSRKELDLMEAAFEKSSKYARETSSGDEITKALEFGYSYNDTSSRLIGIMQNIIDNEGHFVP